MGYRATRSAGVERSRWVRTSGGGGGRQGGEEDAGVGKEPPPASEAVMAVLLGVGWDTD